MIEIEHAQTALFEEDIIKLKIKTKESTTKRALAKAVEHYMKCRHNTNEKIQDHK